MKRAPISCDTRRGTRYPEGNPGNAGFTLIEMIGVLAIMGLVAAVLTPNLAQQISRSKAAEDVSEIAAIREALMRHVALQQSIPGAGTWHSKAAALLGLSTQQVRYSIPEDTTTERVYLIHPSFQPSINGGIGDSIWTQGSGGATQISNARALLLSVHRAGLTMPVTSGVAANPNVFESIWNWNHNPATDSPPAGWPSSWAGNGKYLHVERLNFEPLFQRVTFSNSEYPDKEPYYQIGTASVTRMSSSATFVSWYLVNTYICVYADNEGSSTPGSLQLNLVLKDGANFVYGYDQWQFP